MAWKRTPGPRASSFLRKAHGPGVHFHATAGGPGKDGRVPRFVSGTYNLTRGKGGRQGKVGRSPARLYTEYTTRYTAARSPPRLPGGRTAQRR